MLNLIVREAITFVSARDRTGLLHKIDLKPNVISVFVGVPTDRNHGKQIHERLAVFAIIDDVDLHFFAERNFVLQMTHGVIVGVMPFLTGLHRTIGCLQKSTILTENLMPRVTGQTLEYVRAVHDGQIVLVDVAHNESA